MDNCCCCNSFIAGFEKIILLDISLKIFKIDQYKGFVFINNVADCSLEYILVYVISLDQFHSQELCILCINS